MNNVNLHTWMENSGQGALAGWTEVLTRVHQTARNWTGYRGYRSNRPGPVPVPGG